MREENVTMWNSLQNSEIKQLASATQGLELLDRMATVYAHLGDIERVIKMKWLLLAKEQGGYKIEYFCEAWK